MKKLRKLNKKLIKLNNKNHLYTTEKNKKIYNSFHNKILEWLEVFPFDEASQGTNSLSVSTLLLSSSHL